MINILNDLKEYCEGCPYMILVHCETLGSGKLAYTCKYKRICEHCVEKITDMQGEDKPERVYRNKKEEKLRKLKRQLLTAGDRRDWDECERIEKEIEELEGDKDK